MCIFTAVSGRTKSTDYMYEHIGVVEGWTDSLEMLTFYYSVLFSNNYMFYESQQFNKIPHSSMGVKLCELFCLLSVVVIAFSSP